MKKLTFILFFILTQMGFAQEVEFTVKPNKTEIGLNEELRIEFIMNIHDNDSFQPPDFKGFKLKSKTPAQRISQTYVDGVRSFEKAYTYVLEPVETGIFYIGSATISKNWEKHKTPDLEIKVTDSVENPNQPKNVEVEVYLIAEANLTEVYERELFVVNYKLLFNKEIDVNRIVSKGSSTVDYTDFVTYTYPKEEITKGEEIYNGKTYNKIEFDKMYFFSVKSGNFTLAPLEFEVELLVPSEKKDFFGKTIFDKITKNVKTNLINIKAKPFPEERKYEFFYGLVGKYNFSQKIVVDKPYIKLGETFGIEMIIEGTGNQLVFPMPKPNLSEGLEMVEEKEEEPVFYSDKPEFLLRKTYTIKPKYTGGHTIGEIMYAYFDPVKKKYIYDMKNKGTITVID